MLRLLGGPNLGKLLVFILFRDKVWCPTLADRSSCLNPKGVILQTPDAGASTPTTDDPAQGAGEPKAIEEGKHRSMT